MHSFTSEDLLQYIYGETSTAKSAAIKAALEIDWSLQEKLALLTSSKTELENVSFSPSSKSIENILNYAQKVAEEMAPTA